MPIVGLVMSGMKKKIFLVNLFFSYAYMAMRFNGGLQIGGIVTSVQQTEKMESVYFLAGPRRTTRTTPNLPKGPIFAPKCAKNGFL